jgi:hypothetical protein
MRNRRGPTCRTCASDSTTGISGPRPAASSDGGGTAGVLRVDGRAGRRIASDRAGHAQHRRFAARAEPRLARRYWHVDRPGRRYEPRGPAGRGRADGHADSQQPAIGDRVVVEAAFDAEGFRGGGHDATPVRSDDVGQHPARPAPQFGTARPGPRAGQPLIDRGPAGERFGDPGRCVPRRAPRFAGRGVPGVRGGT